jgi:hypothetical protein
MAGTCGTGITNVGLAEELFLTELKAQYKAQVTDAKGPSGGLVHAHNLPDELTAYHLATYAAGHRGAGGSGRYTSTTGEISPETSTGGYGSPTYIATMNVFNLAGPYAAGAKLSNIQNYFKCSDSSTIEEKAQQAAEQIIQNILIDFDDAPSDSEISDLKGADKDTEATAAQLQQDTAREGVAGKWEITYTPGDTNFPFSEQCYLMSHLWELAEFHKTNQLTGVTRKDLPDDEDPSECIPLDADSPFGFINKLTQRPEDAALNNMKTSEIASLQPMIRLFKVSGSSPKEKMQEFIFDAYYGAGGKDGDGLDDISRYLGDKNSRGQGVGIKDFTFTYEGENPYAIKKSISAKLTIFANSFDELLRIRRSPRGIEDVDEALSSYQFSDLALKTGKRRGLNADTEGTTDSSGKLDFRLMAVVGWQNPKPPDGISTPGLRDAINDSYVTLNLTPTIHTFDFDDTGRVTFTIEYLAYIDDLFESPYFNIFGELQATTAVRSVLERKLKYNILNEECKYDEVDAMEEEDYKDYRSEQIRAQEKLMIVMFNLSRVNKGVWELPISSKDVINHTSNGPFGKLGDNTPESFGTQKYVDSAVFTAAMPHLRSAGEVVELSTITSNPISVEYWQHRAWATAQLAGQDAFAISYLGMPKNLAIDATGATPGTLPTTDSTVRKNLEKAAPSLTTLSYFYAGDLIDMILRNINNGFSEYIKSCAKLEKNVPDVPGKEGTKVTSKERWKEMVQAEKGAIKSFQKEFQRFRLILGPIEIFGNGGQKKVINLSDVPIAVSYFLSWLDDQMTSRDVVDYSLPAFLSDFFNQMIRDYLNHSDCFSGLKKTQYVRLSQNVVVGYESAPGLDSVVKEYFNSYWNMNIPRTGAPSRPNLSDPSLPYPLIQMSGPAGDPRQFDHNRDNQYNYMIFYAGRIQPQEDLNGDKSEDEKKGIFHYAIGRDRGLTKTINLQRSSTPGLAELRYEQQGYKGLMQLRETYDATINSFANVKALPGTYIYIDPKGFAPSTWGHTQIDAGDANFDLTHLGLGGYYMIKRSTHSFGPGRADSSVDAVWVAEVEATGMTATVSVSENVHQTPAKCKIKPQK